MLGSQVVVELTPKPLGFLTVPDSFNIPANLIELPVKKQITFLEHTSNSNVVQIVPPTNTVPIEYVYINSDTLAEYGKFYIVDADNPITVTAPANNITDGFFGVYDGYLKATTTNNIVTVFLILHGEPGTYTINFPSGGSVFKNTGTSAGWIKQD